MKLVIEIKMDNDAFWPEGSGFEQGIEAQRILEEAAKKLPEGLSAGLVWSLKDINGNTVGKMEVK